MVSAEIAQNQKWHLFFEKVGIFDMGEKVGFTNCVFEKLCFFFWKHYFYSVFSKAQQLQIKNVCWKTEKLWKIVGCFWTWHKGVFVCFFSGFNVIVVCFCVSGKVARVLKMISFFPSFFGLCGVAYSCLVGFGRFRCFCVSCFCLFCLSVVSVLFAFVFVLLLDCFWCCCFFTWP